MDNQAQYANQAQSGLDKGFYTEKARHPNMPVAVTRGEALADRARDISKQIAYIGTRIESLSVTLIGPTPCDLGSAGKSPLGKDGSPGRLSEIEYALSDASAGLNNIERMLDELNKVV